MRRLLIVLCAVAISALALPVSAAAPTPATYRLTKQETIVPGLDHYSLVRDETKRHRRQAVEVLASTPGVQAAVHAVISNGTLSEPVPDRRLETTSRACQRVGCLAGINAGYGFTKPQEPEYGLPVGGNIVDGRFLRSPSPRQNQLALTRDGQWWGGIMEWSGGVSLFQGGLATYPLAFVNRNRNLADWADQLGLYTSNWGPSTQTNQHGQEVVLKVLDGTPGDLVGQTTLVQIGPYVAGQNDTPLQAGEIVLSGHGEAADIVTTLARDHQGEQLLLRLDTKPDAVQSVNAGVWLVRGGQVVGDPRSPVNPLTMFGWNDLGATWMVTADGRQPKTRAAGIKLDEAARLMAELGATWAINLDGGGSTTMVVQGQVVNNPSEAVPDGSRNSGQERAVRDYLFWMPKALQLLQTPTGTDQLDLPKVERIPTGYASPIGASRSSPPLVPSRWPAVVAMLLLMAWCVALGHLWPRLQAIVDITGKQAYFAPMQRSWSLARTKLCDQGKQLGKMVGRQVRERRR